MLFHGERDERVFIMKKFSEWMRAKKVMLILRHARLRVASGNGTLSQATKTTFFFFDLRETQRRSSRPLRLGEQRISNLAAVKSGRKAITE